MQRLTLGAVVTVLSVGGSTVASAAARASPGRVVASGGLPVIRDQAVLLAYQR